MLVDEVRYDANYCRTAIATCDMLASEARKGGHDGARLYWEDAARAWEQRLLEALAQ
jgi:hypothetical protein